MSGQLHFNAQRVGIFRKFPCVFNFMDRLADGLGVELDPARKKRVEMKDDAGR